MNRRKTINRRPERNKTHSLTTYFIAIGSERRRGLAHERVPILERLLLCLAAWCRRVLLLLLTASRRDVHQVVGARVTQPRRPIELRLATVRILDLVVVFALIVVGGGVQLGARGRHLGLIDGGRCVDKRVGVRRREVAERVLERRGDRRDVEGGGAHRGFGQCADYLIRLVALVLHPIGPGSAGPSACCGLAGVGDEVLGAGLDLYLLEKGLEGGLLSR